MSQQAHEALGAMRPRLDGNPALSAVLARVHPIALRYWFAEGPPDPDMAIIVSKEEMLTVARCLYFPDTVTAACFAEGRGQIMGWLVRSKAHKFNLLITLFGFPLVCKR